MTRCQGRLCMPSLSLWLVKPLRHFDLRRILSRLKSILVGGSDFVWLSVVTATICIGNSSCANYHSCIPVVRFSPSAGHHWPSRQTIPLPIARRFSSISASLLAGPCASLVTLPTTTFLHVCIPVMPFPLLPVHTYTRMTALLHKLRPPRSLIRIEFQPLGSSLRVSLTARSISALTFDSTALVILRIIPTAMVLPSFSHPCYTESRLATSGRAKIDHAHVCYTSVEPLHQCYCTLHTGVLNI